MTLLDYLQLAAGAAESKSTSSTGDVIKEELAKFNLETSHELLRGIIDIVGIIGIYKVFSEITSEIANHSHNVNETCEVCEDCRNRLKLLKRFVKMNIAEQEKEKSS